jgi:D-alanyl-D-alanine carboxypeptidase
VSTGWPPSRTPRGIGTLSLDDLASKWLGDRPWFSKLPNADEIRVRHLLSHSAGIGDYLGRPGFLLAMVGRVLRHGSAYFEPEELIRFALSRRPLFPVGEGYRYFDVGYLVLGRLIEAASGRSYYELLDERILTPLELDEIAPADRSVLTNITPGYTGGARNLKKDGRMKLGPPLRVDRRRAHHQPDHAG